MMDTSAGRSISVWRRCARRLRHPDVTVPLTFLLPSLILLFGLIAYPMGVGFWLSLTDGSLLRAGEFVGLSNYADLLTSNEFYKVLRFSTIYAVANVMGCYVLGLSLALLMNRAMPGKGVFRVLLLLPWIIPSLVAAIGWRWMAADEHALFNQFLRLFGSSPIYFLSDQTWTIVIVIAAKIWRSFPFMMLSLLAALQGIDRSLYEAAAIDGATRWQMFWEITLPQIKTVSIVLALLMTIWSVNDFDMPWLIAQGGPAGATENLIVYAFRFTFGRNDVGMGAAVSFFTMLVLMILVVVMLRRQKDS